MAAPPEIQHPSSPPTTNQHEARPKPSASDGRQQISQARVGAGPPTAASSKSNEDNPARSWSTRAPPRSGTNGTTLRNALVCSSKPEDEQSVPPLPVPRVCVPSEHMNGGNSSTASVGGPRPNLDTLVPTQVKAATPLKDNGQLLRLHSAARSQESSKELPEKKRELDDAVLPASKRRSMDQASHSLTPAGGQKDFLQKYLEVDAINKQNYLEADTINKGALAREVLDLRCENQSKATELDAALKDRDAALSDNGSLRQENETRLRKFKTLEAELITEKSQAGGLRKEVVSLREELASKKCRIGDLEKENAEMKDLKDALESDVKAKAKTNSENAKLMHKMRTKAKESDQEKAKLKDYVSSVEQKLKSMEREKEHASTSLKRNEETRISMLQKAETKFKTLETEKDNLSADLGNEKSARQESEKEAKKLQTEKDDLSAELQSEVSARQKAENESKRTQMEKNKLSAELHNEISARQKSENEVKRLQNERENLSAELRNERSAGQKSENEVKRLQNERVNLSAELRDEKSARQTSVNEVKQLQTENYNMFAILKYEKSSSQKYENELKKLQTEKDDISAELQYEKLSKQKSENQVKQLQTENDNLSADVRNETLEKQKLAADLDHQGHNYAQQLEEQRTKHDETVKKLTIESERGMQEKMVMRDREYQMLLESSDAEKKQLQSTIDRIDAKTGNIDQLRGSSPFGTCKSITDSEKVIHSLNGRLTQKEAEVAVHRSKSMVLKYDLAEKESKIAELEDEIRRAADVKKDLKSQLSELKKECEEKEIKEVFLQSQISGLEKNCEEKKTEVVSLQSQNTELEKKCEEKETKVVSLQSELQREEFEQLRKQETTKHSVSCQTEPEERRDTHTNLPPIKTVQGPASPPDSCSPPMMRRRSSTSSKTAQTFNPPSGPRALNPDEDAEDGRQENWTGCKNRYCRLHLNHFGPCQKHARYCRLNSDHTGACIVAFPARRGSYRQDDRRRSRSPRRDSTYDSGYWNRGHDTWRR